MADARAALLTIGRLDRAAIRRIAAQRMEQIALKLADLRRMQQALAHLLAQREHTRPELPCPIIASLAQGYSAPAHRTTDQR